MTDHPASSIEQEARCLSLGLLNDPGTWFGSPSPWNCCHRVRRPQAVTLRHQAAFCLSGACAQCPIFQQQDSPLEMLPAEIRADLPQEEIPPPPPSRKTLILAGGAALFAVIGLVLCIIAALATMPGRSAEALTATSTRAIFFPTPSVVSPTAAETGAPTAAAQTQGTTAPTPTVLDVTPSPTIVFEMTPASLAYDTNLRKGPGMDFEVITQLKAETSISVIGRDELGVWIAIFAENQYVGWVVASQIVGDVDILRLPHLTALPSVAELARTGTVSAGGRPTHMPITATYEGREPTSTPQLPYHFDITVAFTAIGQRCYDDFSINYTITISGMSITLSRSLLTIYGSFDPSTGLFEGTTTYEDGTESLEGRIYMDGMWVVLDGEMKLIYRQFSCPGEWRLYGKTFMP